MLKDKIIKSLDENKNTHNSTLGYFYYDDGHDSLFTMINDNPSKKKLDDFEFFITEFDATGIDDDYHGSYIEQNFKGTFLAFKMNLPDTKKYFGIDYTPNYFDKKEFLRKISEIIKNHNLGTKEGIDYDFYVSNTFLKICFFDRPFDERILSLKEDILEYIRVFHESLGTHITRMFGSFIFIKKIDGTLHAVDATKIPIKYCPLMSKLLYEVGGPEVKPLLESIKNDNNQVQKNMMCRLIDRVVIKGGYFDTSRPLNSCEANVLFGASETISSAFKNNLLDAAVIVSNNLGTIITTNSSNTQGAVKRMTGLFATSPSKELSKTAEEANIIQVFPHTGSIDQIEGVKKAINLGYRRIAVTLASSDNILLKELHTLEEEYGVTIYKFALCSTGIDESVGLVMRDYADIVWSCASKYVKELIEPSAIAQVGVKIPVHIMTNKGWILVKNHLLEMSSNLEESTLTNGDNKPVYLNDRGSIKLLPKKDIKKCQDCPSPCV